MKLVWILNDRPESRWWFLRGPWLGFSGRGGIRQVKIKSSTSHCRLSRILCILISLQDHILYYVHITTVAVYFYAYLLYFIIITNGGDVRDRRSTGPICTRAFRVSTLRPQSCQSREKHRRPVDRYGSVERLTRPDDDEGRGIPSRLECIFLLFGFVSLTVSLTLHHPLHHLFEDVTAAHPPPPPQRKQWTVPTV